MPSPPSRRGCDLAVALASFNQALRLEALYCFIVAGGLLAYRRTPFLPWRGGRVLRVVGNLGHGVGLHQPVGVFAVGLTAAELAATYEPLDLFNAGAAGQQLCRLGERDKIIVSDVYCHVPALLV